MQLTTSGVSNKGEERNLTHASRSISTKPQRSSRGDRHRVHNEPKPKMKLTAEVNQFGNLAKALIHIRYESDGH